MIKRKNSNVNILYINILFLFIFCLIIFIFFRKNEVENSLIQKNNIESMLRNESHSANSYSISKIIADLEKSKVINCSKLSINNTITYYDTLSFSNCSNFFLKKLRLVNINISSSNGTTFNFSYIPKLNFLLLYFEISIYLILISASFLINLYLKVISQRNSIKLALLEFEKNSIVNKNQQISHDLSSPLSAIKMLVSLLTNLDPEIKNILLNSVKRTEEIFENLKLNIETNVEKVNIANCILEIINEKKVSSQINFEFNMNETSQNLYFIGSKSYFLRILSNLFNNSIDALNDSAVKDIFVSVYLENDNSIVLIKDTGKGIPKNILSKIGTRGFSHGKEDIPYSGQGIGLYDAITWVSSIGGDLKITSDLNQGTSVLITLPLTSTPKQSS